MKRPPEVVLELSQFVPILSFAVPFMATGSVDLAQAGGAFALATGLSVLVMGALRLLGHPQNPIHIATNLWLAMGAFAFAVPVPAVVAFYSEWGALSLFATVLVYGFSLWGTGVGGGFLVGLGATEDQWKRLSPVLLGLTVVAIAWAWFFRDSLRLGGGLPFITLNIVRRALIKRTAG